MLLTLVVLYSVADLFVASESIQDTSANILEEKRMKPNQGALSFYASINNIKPTLLADQQEYLVLPFHPNPLPHPSFSERAGVTWTVPLGNKTFYEKEVNPVRVPDKFFEQRKKKSKITKPPKRTIQKIIRNGKNRNRKIYAQAVTRQPQMVTSEDVEMQFSNTQKNVERNIKPTEHTHKKKPKKNLRVARYPMPFQNFQSKMNAKKRNRRDIARDDVFIIKDLDEMEFLSKDKDYDVVRTHVQNHW